MKENRVHINNFKRNIFKRIDDTFIEIEVVIVCVLLLLIMLIIPFSANADFYKCIDDNGNITFSDTPCSKDAVKLKGYSYYDKSDDVTDNQIIRDNESSNVKNTSCKVNPDTAKAIVRFTNGEQIILSTKTMKSNRGMSWHLGNNLALPSGINVPFLRMKNIEIKKAYDDSFIKINIKMCNGETYYEKIKKPWLSISGETAVGRFSKSLIDIKSIEFRQR